MMVMLTTFHSHGLLMKKDFDKLEEQGRSSAETHIICQSTTQIVPVIVCDCTHAPETFS